MKFSWSHGVSHVFVSHAFTSSKVLNCKMKALASAFESKDIVSKYGPRGDFRFI